MIPKRIVLENFLSFGSPETEIVFTDDEPLWVLGGPNGVGKSAVFDGMTYALYGEHRGGASDHTSLVRHGANGFRVVFEFEFNGVSYQITRNRPMKGRPTQSIKRWADGGWTQSVELPQASGRQDPIRLWTERTLGIGFPAFKASVLLRQGEADAIINAGGAERLNILKKIIGLEAYERLSENVHNQTRRCKDQLDELRTRREGMTEVTEGEVSAAEAELRQKEEERSGAQEAVTKAAGRVPVAGQWVSLERESKTLNQQIRDADARAAEAKRICTDFARLNDLAAAVPVFREIIKLRDDLVSARELLTDRKSEANRLADAIRAKQLREEIGKDQKFVNAADEVKRLKEGLGKFDVNLTDQLEAAREGVRVTTEALTSTLEAKAEANGLLGQAKAQQERFATVGVGVKCSLCGQEVTEKHAKVERTRLAGDIKALEKRFREAEKTESLDTKAKRAAEEEWKRLDKLARNRDTTASLLTDKENTLRGLGVTSEPDELRTQLADKVTEAERLEARAGDHFPAELPTLKKALGEVEQKVRADEQSIAKMDGRHSTFLGQLSPKWNGQVEKLDAAQVETLEVERKRLEEGRISDKFRRLEQDTAERSGWVNRLNEVNGQMKGIPQDCRTSVADAEAYLKAAEQIAKNADNARDTAQRKAQDLKGQAERFSKLVEEIAGAEKKADLHRKLDDLLGKAGLQRELVRTAEREIVRLANDTVQNLSDGDLTVELDDSEDGGDQAFSLQVRRADGPTPIGVNYLSGSQKFRVAVSVALAIGRFAAGQARPLESVIIDEGFGSLDRDGLRAAATELNRLRQHLRRIVLVSHQEEFADRFPVVIRLSQGENGTKATAERK
jgi:DNA repair exonuclease SbcCD ATPase subunit